MMQQGTLEKKKKTRKFEIFSFGFYVLRRTKQNSEQVLGEFRNTFLANTPKGLTSANSSFGRALIFKN